MRKLIIGNWKANPTSVAEAQKLFRAYRALKINKECEVVVCPPFSYLSFAPRLKSLQIGAQDIFWEKSGAYTGEVTPTMLKNHGVKYAIIGHSERRKLCGETDEMVNKKVLAALFQKIIPVICVGESGEIRKKGMSFAKKYVEGQLEKALVKVPKNAKVIVAYEPIWAIGTGEADDPKSSAEMAELIRDRVRNQGLKVSVIYGGSVNAQNAPAFLSETGIDGALVGGASLNSKAFQAIIGAASK